MNKLLFVFSLLALAHAFFGYPIAILALSLWRPRRIAAADWEPEVDIVLAVHNAAPALETKLRNLLALDYPADKLRIHVASDGSEDGTTQVLRAADPARVIAHVFPLRRGKSACLGDIVPTLRGEVVVFCDVRQRIEPEALRALLRPLADPDVGAVSGELMFQRSASEFSGGVDAYWRYEKFIRRHESESGSVVGVSGALYAARRSLLPAIPPGLILDDLWIPLQIARDGARVVFASDARAWDRPSGDAALEAQRKRRTLAGNFQLIARQPGLLLPWTHPLGWRLWGHKWLRLLAPWLMLVLFVSNATLVPGSRRWLALFLGQCAFYAMAALGMLAPGTLRFLPIRLAATFVRMNGYAVLGLYDFLARRRMHLWSVTRQPDGKA